MKVIALVVTYNRIKLLKQCIKGIMNQSYKPSKILIIDNASTDGTEDFCYDLRRKNPNWIDYQRMSENTGGAGGFSVGLRSAVKMEMDYVWGMDDDAEPHIDALKRLVKKTDTYGPEKYCLTSNIRYISQEGIKIKESVDSTDENMEVLTFVGFFLPRKIIELIGYPREDLFIYYDDTDYSIRIKKAGYYIIGILDSIIEHPNNISGRKVLMGKQISIPEMCDWKLYYWMRNNLLILGGGGANISGQLYLRPMSF